MFNARALWEEISYANQYWLTMSLENSSFLHKAVLLQTKDGRGMAGGGRVWLGGMWLGESEGVVCPCLMNDNFWGRPFNLEPYEAEKGLASESRLSGDCAQHMFTRARVCTHTHMQGS